MSDKFVSKPSSQATISQSSPVSDRAWKVLLTYLYSGFLRPDLRFLPGSSAFVSGVGSSGDAPIDKFMSEGVTIGSSSFSGPFSESSPPLSVRIHVPPDLQDVSIRGQRHLASGGLKGEVRYMTANNKVIFSIVVLIFGLKQAVRESPL
jgi:hypothetical protein